MPTYEYHCRHCSRQFDLYHAVGEDPGPCPWCHGTVRRIFSSVGVIFKGSGFYSTDHRKAPPQNEGAPKESTSEREGKTSKESTSDGSGKSSTSDGSGKSSAAGGTTS